MLKEKIAYIFQLASQFLFSAQAQFVSTEEPTAITVSSGLISQNDLNNLIAERNTPECGDNVQRQNLVLTEAIGIIMSLYQETMRKLQSLNKRRAEIEKEIIESQSLELQTKGKQLDVLANNFQLLPDKDIIKSSVESNKIIERLRDSSMITAEQEILRELLYAFQGICGNVLTKNALMEDRLVFQMTTETGDQSLRQQVLHLAVLGTMYQKLNAFIDMNNMDSVSVFLSALASAIRDQLTSYLCLLSHLERRISSPYGSVNLLQLRVETLGARRHLSWLVTATEACKFQLGCNVLSTLYTLMLSGNPQVLKSISPLFLRVSEVFYHFLKEWFSCSRLTDPYEEFFIALNTSKLGVTLLMQDYYVIRDLMCPSYLSKAQIDRILRVGRSFALLKEILGEKHPLAEMHKKLQRKIEIVTTDAKLGVNAWKADGTMHTFLIEMELEVSRKLAIALLHHGKLFVHLEILTGFFLLRQSGFAAQLIMKLFDMLSVAAPLVSKYTLREQLRLAINNTTSPEQEDVELEKRIKIHFKPQPEHDLGWDSFDVTYELEKENPVNLVVTKEVLDKYYFCFKEILQLRRMEWMLCDILKSIKTTYRKLHQLTGRERVVLNHMHLLAKEMHVLVQQVLNNILQVRLEANWHQLCERIKSIPSIEAIYELHQEYLANIQIYLFSEQMHEILNLTIELNDLFQSFMLAFKFPVSEQRYVGDDREDTSCSESSTATPSKTIFSPSSVPRRLENLRSDFYELVMNFLQVVKQRPEEDMQNLYDLINLNNFYRI